VVGVSAGASWPAPGPRPPLGIDTPPRALTSTRFIASPLPVLAEADLQEHQEQGSAKPSRHQGDGEHLGGQPADQVGADRTGDNEHGGRPKRQDA
jgi:hypothetical protein